MSRYTGRRRLFDGVMRSCDSLWGGKFTSSVHSPRSPSTTLALLNLVRIVVSNLWILKLCVVPQIEFLLNIVVTLSVLISLDNLHAV